MESLIGQTLGRYQITQLLGEGGMGAVCRARDVTLGRDVAIKMLHAQFARQPDFRARFLQEAQIAARLDHPSIVKVYDFGQEQNTLYIVMEFIPGDNLQQLLAKLQAKGQWIVLPEAIELIRQIGLALDYAHRVGVLHRDIKPANIMIKVNSDKSELFQPVLTDLGLAKLSKSGLSTQSGMTMGTPNYMSPEQVLGEEIDARSDVYSLGILFYELAVGRRPFPIHSMTDAIRYHMREQPPPPRAIRPDLPLTLERVILRAMAKAPAERFPTAAALVRALTEITLTDLPTTVPNMADEALSVYTQVQEDLSTQYGSALTNDFPQPEVTSSKVGRLQILAPDGSVRTLPIQGSKLIIGRDESCDLLLKDEKVSRQHAQIQFDGMVYRVTDLESRNGTFLGEVQLLAGVPEVWQPDTRLRVGNHWLRLTFSAKAAVVSSPMSSDNAYANITSGAYDVDLGKKEMPLPVQGHIDSAITSDTEKLPSELSGPAHLVGTKQRWSETNLFVWISIALALVISIFLLNKWVLTTIVALGAFFWFYRASIIGILDKAPSRTDRFSTNQSHTQARVNPATKLFKPETATHILHNINEAPSIVLKREHQALASHVSNDIVEELIVQRDLERLKSFIADSEGGRFILTGYGRFGGTSLIKGGISKAKRELRERGSDEGVLLVFYFNVKENVALPNKFTIEANGFSFAELSAQHQNAVANPKLKDLQAHAKDTPSLSGESLDSQRWEFSVATPLDASFLRMSNVTSIFSKRSHKVDFDFVRFIDSLDNYFGQQKNNNELQKIVLQLINSDVLPSRVVIILDRIRTLETLETLANLDLFRNEHVSVIAISRTEDFERWDNYERRLGQLNFKKWYVPCLWQNSSDFKQSLHHSLLEARNLPKANAQETLATFLKHLQLVGKGAIGEVVDELKHPQYWRSDGVGNRYLSPEDLITLPRVQHNAWMFDVLELNWSFILAGLFGGKEMDEEEDRVRIGICYLLDWIAQNKIFTFEQLKQAAHDLPMPIDKNNTVVAEVLQNLVEVLKNNSYLKLIDQQYRVMWNKTAPPIPQAVSPKVTEDTPTDIQDVTLYVADVDAIDDLPNSSSISPELEETIIGKEDFSVAPSPLPQDENDSAEENPYYTPTLLVAHEQQPISILFMAADPRDATHLRIGEEFREIQEKLRLAKHRDRFNLHSPRMAVRSEDISQALLDIKPTIVHFSGHGVNTGELYLENRSGEIQPASPAALAFLFKQFADQIECVVLNACYSETQAQAIAEHIEHVIGMSQAVEDKVAISFAIGFYQALGGGRTIEEAFELGCAQSMFQGIPDHLGPVLIPKRKTRFSK